MQRQWFKGAQKEWVWFYSAHLFAMKYRYHQGHCVRWLYCQPRTKVNSLAALAFRKSPDILNIKRQATVLRPYNSTSEYFLFSRGQPSHWRRKASQVTGFASFRQVDGSIQSDTSFLQRGLFLVVVNIGPPQNANRTGEEERRSRWTHLAVISAITRQGSICLNGVQHNFSTNRSAVTPLHNNYTFKGKQLTNYSFDWGYTFRNIHWYGEAAMHNNKYFGLISGMLMSVDPKVICRWFTEIYRPVTNPFWKCLHRIHLPNQWKGLYTGHQYQNQLPNGVWMFMMFQGSWLRYW